MKISYVAYLMQHSGMYAMSISPNQCRAARGFFAMSQQELANASGVSLRTISSFEDASDRLPTAANLAAIEKALRRLGAVFQDDGSVEWSPPFTETQIRVILALQVRNGPTMTAAAELIKEARCDRADLELLAQLQILTGIDGYPVLTPIGHHIPGLLRDKQSRDATRATINAPINYTVRLDDRTVFHAPTAAVFRIEEDGTLSTLFDKFVPEGSRDDVVAGAREALRRHRQRSPSVGDFVWR
jgi:transcriptional regulator with XRE-family HTH domain